MLTGGDSVPTGVLRTSVGLSPTTTSPLVGYQVPPRQDRTGQDRTQLGRLLLHSLPVGIWENSPSVCKSVSAPLCAFFQSFWEIWCPWLSPPLSLSWWISIFLLLCHRSEFGEGEGIYTCDQSATLSRKFFKFILYYT